MVTKTTAVVSFGATITLTEQECRALDALVGYGSSAFLKAFKEKLGEVYMRDHEAGLHSFFATVGRDVLPALGAIDDARKLLGRSIGAKNG